MLDNYFHFVDFDPVIEPSYLRKMLANVSDKVPCKVEFRKTTEHQYDGLKRTSDGHITYSSSVHKIRGIISSDMNGTPVALDFHVETGPIDRICIDRVVMSPHTRRPFHKTESKLADKVEKAMRSYIAENPRE